LDVGLVIFVVLAQLCCRGCSIVVVAVGAITT